MKVLMLSGLFPRPENPLSGCFIPPVITELSRSGVHVRILSPVPWTPHLPLPFPRLRRVQKLASATPSSWLTDGIKVEAPRYLKLPHELDLGSYGYLYYLGVRKAVQKIYREEGFDLIHGQMLVPDGFAAAMLGREFKKPALATELGYAAVLARGKLWERAQVRWALENLDQTVFVSQALADLTCSLATPRRPPKVVYTGLDAELFTPGDKKEARRKLALPMEGKILLHVGEHNVNKGVQDLLEAFRLLADHCRESFLYLVGAGSLDSLLTTKIKEYGLVDRIFLAGNQPHEQIPFWLQACDLVVHPTRYREGLPNALVEASAMARAIVATRVGGIPEVVTDQETGILVAPGDIRALAASIRQLLEDPQLSQQMGEKGRKKALARFSWKRHGDEMIQIYQSVLNSL